MNDQEHTELAVKVYKAMITDEPFTIRKVMGSVSPDLGRATLIAVFIDLVQKLISNQKVIMSNQEYLKERLESMNVHADFQELRTETLEEGYELTNQHLTDLDQDMEFLLSNPRQK